jgi:anti-sigma-K factor RskA
MTKNRVIVLAVVAIVLLLAAMYLRGPSSVPGQEPLVALSNTNFSDFENAFDRDSDASRLVLLLSPT